MLDALFAICSGVRRSLGLENIPGDGEHKERPALVSGDERIAKLTELYQVCLTHALSYAALY
jgi:hypothetical protein